MQIVLVSIEGLETESFLNGLLKEIYIVHVFLSLLSLSYRRDNRLKIAFTLRSNGDTEEG